MAATCKGSCNQDAHDDAGYISPEKRGGKPLIEHTMGGNHHNIYPYITIGRNGVSQQPTFYFSRMSVDVLSPQLTLAPSAVHRDTLGICPI